MLAGSHSLIHISHIVQKNLFLLFFVSFRSSLHLRKIWRFVRKQRTLSECTHINTIQFRRCSILFRSGRCLIVVHILFALSSSSSSANFFHIRIIQIKIYFKKSSKLVLPIEICVTKSREKEVYFFAIFCSFLFCT